MLTPESFNGIGAGKLPGHLGIVITRVSESEVGAELTVNECHLAPNGFLHAGTVVTLADTCAGYGCIANLPPGASGFTTIELKSNFFGTCRGGAIACEATRVHGGRSTQVWDAAVKDESNGRMIALFRCTQMILYPKT